MYKTASLFPNLKRLVVTKANARQLELQATVNWAIPQPNSKDALDFIAALGQLFFMVFDVDDDISPPPHIRRPMIPEWIDQSDIDTLSIKDPVVNQIQRGFQTLFQTFVKQTVVSGLNRKDAIEQARRETCYHYQWMVMNLVLPEVVDANLQTEILNSEAPLYAEFCRQNTSKKSQGLTYPEEFIHLIVPIISYLFQHALKQQPSFSFLLDDLQCRRFPPVQVAIQDVFKRTGFLLDPPKQFQNTAQMPIWAFLIDEIKLQDRRNRIGSFGSYILGETIIGMLISNPKTYWHQSGSDAGRWSPDDGSLGKPIDTLEKLLAVQP